MNEMLTRRIGFNTGMNRINEGECPLCNKEIHKDEFKDALSRKEYGIPGMCQECQDNLFA